MGSTPNPGLTMGTINGTLLLACVLTVMAPRCNRGILGSTPSVGSRFLCCPLSTEWWTRGSSGRALSLSVLIKNGLYVDVAQLIERNLAKVEVAGLTPVIHSMCV